MSEWTVAELVERLSAGLPVCVVDIREPAEYEEWHIPGSSNLPVFTALARGEFETAAAGLSGLKSESPVVTVCRMGHTSKRAVTILAQQGQTAFSLAGGMHAWSGAHTAVPVPLDDLSHAVLIQVRRNGKGCLSYLIGSGGEAAVIDPALDSQVYSGLARKYGLKITLVLETHIHADHISRARILAAESGARYLLSENGRVAFEYEALKDADSISIGDLSLAVLATPGHTGESVCFYLDGFALISGDTLFVDSVGRPDLESGDAGTTAGANQLYTSLHERVLTLPDDTQICPGHSSSPVSFDRTPIVRRLGEIRAELALLSAAKTSFVRQVSESLPAQPPSYDAIIALNEGKAELGDMHPFDLEAGPNRCAAC